MTKWEQTTTADGPALRVVTTGSREANVAQGFRSQVLLDPQFEVGQAFGASGTPAAVVLDNQGLVASDIGVGADEVKALLRLVRA